MMNQTKHSPKKRKEKVVGIQNNLKREKNLIIAEA